MTFVAVPPLVRACGRALLVLCALVLSIAPSSASASLLADRLELVMYGRVGAAWTPSGRYIQGRTFNLTGSSIGGRLEEGDYLEPTIKLHLLEKKDDPDAAYVDVVLTPSMYASNGLFVGIFSNRFSQTLQIELFQAYVEAGNVLLPRLRVWAGARFYRGGDVHIADYFYFNNLSSQGAGIAYGPLDVAVLLQTSATGSQYNFDVDGDGRLDLRRERTVFVGQYVHKLEAGHSFHFLGELHLLPALKARVADGTEVGLASDFGWVLGAKAHLDLGNGSFNDLSLRYGSRIANGGRAGGQTWDTFGLPDLNGQFSNAAGVEVVEHFLYNFSKLFSLNAYGILHWNQGSSGLRTDKSLNFAAGARSTLYLHDNFHLINEATFQGLRPGGGPLATATKLSIVPTFVPTGERSVWARPHFRLIYTAAFYDQNAREALTAPYLQTVATAGTAVPKVGHYLGTRVEWWF
ncbi:carbohydrate porin [Archangium lipolyticum]|uniref:carbohydrate porin n=1 Tax=Archangium lipolyticum TaxID=2970465 RepID=UPI002149EE66|nr:carbohydrate porin [Archangium lipolyticum]